MQDFFFFQYFPLPPLFFPKSYAIALPKIEQAKCAEHMGIKGNYFPSYNHMKTLRISFRGSWLFSGLDDIDRKSIY